MFIKDPLLELKKGQLNFRINEFERGKSLKSLKERKSMGPDKIHPMILKE